MVTFKVTKGQHGVTRSLVHLSGLPGGAFTLTISTRTVSGKTHAASKHYPSCAG